MLRAAEEIDYPSSRSANIARCLSGLMVSDLDEKYSTVNFEMRQNSSTVCLNNNISIASTSIHETIRVELNDCSNGFNRYETAIEMDIRSNFSNDADMNIKIESITRNWKEVSQVKRLPTDLILRGVSHNDVHQSIREIIKFCKV